MSKSKPTISDLRKLGFQVAVRHNRKKVFIPTCEPEVIQGNSKNDVVIVSPCKWEYEAKGGSTEVVLTWPDGNTTIGVSHAGPYPFNKRQGVNVALGRALKRK